MLNKIYVLIAVLALLFGWHAYDKHKGVQEAITATTSSLNAQHDKALKEANEKALRDQESLQTSANKSREVKDETIRTISNKLSVALSELRNRPQRPPALPEDSSNSQACTARELYREDAEFLTREAARANTVVVERDYYYQQYEEVRNKLNGTTK